MNESPAEQPLRSRLHVPPVGRGRLSRIGALPAAWRAHPARNVTAGGLAAIVSLPLAMGLGALAVAPLGPAYAAAGVLAGLYGAAFLGLLAVLAGARGIAQLLQAVRGSGAQPLFCGHDAHHQTGSMLADHDLVDALGAAHLFTDLDHALEWCESHVLASQALAHAAQAREIEPHELDVCRGLPGTEAAQVRDALVMKTYAHGEVAFAEGEPGDALYVIARGSASVRLRAGEHPGPGIRLMTFSVGTMFGEMAILDREPRSATVVADGPLACYVLSRDAFDRLVEAHPRIGLAMLANIGRELSFRMRRANRTLASLD